jgi:endonuclease/exonuclease/phosphatase family metal-dependent hydrolase
MSLTLGTFNLNNLFSRWNFKASIEEYETGSWPVLKKEAGFWVRRYRGRLILPKSEAMTERLAARIRKAEPDILACQEVEDREVLEKFREERLGRRYPWQVLVEGNDPRLIDVALTSKLPLGEVRSYQHWVHPKLETEPVFRRDLLQVEVLSKDRQRRLFWVFVAHLKSKFVDWRLKDPQARARAQREAARLRRLEAETMAAIIGSRMGPRELYVVCGDLNDTPESPALDPLLGTGQGALTLVNVVARDVPEAERWTASHKEAGQERRFEQIDYILVPRWAEGNIAGTRVDRRRTGITVADGSDHDPVYAQIEP